MDSRRRRQIHRFLITPSFFVQIRENKIQKHENRFCKLFFLPTWRSSQTYVDLLLIQPTREKDMMIITMEERFKAEAGKIQLRGVEEM